MFSENPVCKKWSVVITSARVVKVMSRNEERAICAILDFPFCADFSSLYSDRQRDLLYCLRCLMRQILTHYLMKLSIMQIIIMTNVSESLRLTGIHVI